jgi:glucose/arabinose dehydrogenase
LYVNFTDRKGDTRVVEFRVRADDPDHADPASERELLFVDQPYSNHNGGHLAFGPDGKLYVGLGDGGWAGDPRGNGQNDGTLLAKMLRLDVDAAGIAESGEGARPRPVIVAKGLRNPWRYAFDRATGDLWIADVGQDDYEEVDVLPGAMLARDPARPLPNFGWNVLEGAHCYTPRTCSPDTFVPPLVEYDHDTGCSITGGIVYRGRALPVLTGAYFYADNCTAIIRSVRRGADGRPHDSWEWRHALDPTAQLANLSSFGEDAAGEMYLLSLDGTIYRFDAAP